MGCQDLSQGIFQLCFRTYLPCRGAQPRITPALGFSLQSKLNQADLESLDTQVAILKDLKHPNIVAMRQFFDSPKTAYLVMELMTGGELFDRIVEKEKYSEEEARQVMVKLCEALVYCHSQGIVHRDLKPENLLYASEAEDAAIKIADFGLAKLVSEADMMATACGTPGYVAPEILNGVAYDEKCDMWSLGVILYILLCGFPPFFHDNKVKLFAKIKCADYDYPPSFWDEVSGEAKNLIDSLLVVDPAKRFSAAQVLQHPWMVSKASDVALDSAAAGIKKLQVRKRFRQAVLRVVAANTFRRVISDSKQASDPDLLQLAAGEISKELAASDAAGSGGSGV